MAIKKITQVGGSLAVLIPRDIAEAMEVKPGTPISLTLVGRQLVIEPKDDLASEPSFRRAMAAVLRRYETTFQALADHDAGRDE